ncbi:hypothetical protein [Streptomyces sp. CMB-StM0423]|uniref:hypothetical protein n=1 Tax=Streptomyces sp. CMB-StM0423 TaxID=2059884 RepID=UPI000C704CAE|nr:hypothetical protein [Streptomyces sp. CMB-StM0423]AUH41647.1 hypothetical protein CXR04_16660 [Streptomyces sp. CMB-StM0423]
MFSARGNPQQGSTVAAYAAAPPADVRMGHQSHPWLGHLVVDAEHGGRVGVLRAVAPDVDDIRLEPIFRVPEAPPVAWLQEERGGKEWTTPLTAIGEVPAGDTQGTPREHSVDEGGREGGGRV